MTSAGGMRFDTMGASFRIALYLYDLVACTHTPEVATSTLSLLHLDDLDGVATRVIAFGQSRRLQNKPQ